MTAARCLSYLRVSTTKKGASWPRGPARSDLPPGSIGMTATTSARLAATLATTDKGTKRPPGSHGDPDGLAEGGSEGCRRSRARHPEASQHLIAVGAYGETEDTTM